MSFPLIEVGRVLQREIDAIAEDQYLTAREAKTLLVLADEGPLRPSLLAERAAIGRPDVTRALQSLERAGLAGRIGSYDGRSATLIPTERGKEVAGGIAKAIEEAEVQILAELKPSALKALLAILEALMPRRLDPIAEMFR
ncbi:MAG: MarR family transcriptional regulator [Thermoleophilaceae bacterium]|nr:MarR family transcriptional regulator [Thermoleophilaceae bacterium]